MAIGAGGEAVAGRQEKVERVVAGASTAEALAGAAGVVLPILGLVGVLPFWMAGIAVIVVGGGLLLEGAGLVTEYSALLSSQSGERPAMLGSLSVQALGGGAGLVLGIISLSAAAPLPVLGAAIIALGGAMLLGAGASARSWALEYMSRSTPGPENRIVEEVARASAGAEAFTGLGAVVLGILALAGVGTPATTLILVLAGALALGSAELLGGTSLGARMVSLLTRR